MKCKNCLESDEMQRPLALSPSLLAREYGHQEYLQLGTNSAIKRTEMAEHQLKQDPFQGFFVSLSAEVSSI